MKEMIRNKRGVALVTALLLTLITLVIISGLFYALTQNTKISASQKIYRTSVEATYAGSDVMLKEILPRLFSSESPAAIKTSLSSINLEFYSKADGSCLQDKLLNAPSGWSTNCSAANSTVVNPRVAPDVKFELNGMASNKYLGSAKIVDTIPGTPYLSDWPCIRGWRCYLFRRDRDFKRTALRVPYGNCGRT